MDAEWWYPIIYNDMYKRIMNIMNKYVTLIPSNVNFSALSAGKR